MSAPAFRFEVASMPTVRAREPAVDPAAEVAPAFLPRRDSRQYCATPSQRFDWVAPQMTPTAPVCRSELQICRSTGEAKARFETAFTFDVRELVYPGGPGQSVPVDGKWVYVFRDEKLVVEAKAVGPGVWDGATIDGSKRRPWRSSRGVPVDPGPKGNRHDCFFLLSPVRLTASAIKELEKTRVLELAAVGCASDSFGKTVLAPDPLQWAADAHTQYLAPRIRTLEAWRYDESLVAYHFVARVLKAWIDGGDRADVADELRRGEPGKWLEAHDRGHEEAQRRADEAAAYLAHCVDSPDYLAIERSGVERGGEDLELCAVAVASITPRLLETGPGKKLAQHLVSQDGRVARGIIFQDDRPKLPDEWFDRFRFGEKALLGIFGDLIPSYVDLETKRQQKKLDQLEAAKTVRDRVKHYLENLRIKTKLSRPQEQILTALAKGERPVDQVAKGTSHFRGRRAKILREWERLVIVDEVKSPPKVKAEEPRWPKKLDGFKPLFTGMGWTLGTVVEIANLCNAYEAIDQAPEGEKLKKQIAAIGSWADLIEHGAGLAEELFDRGGHTGALRWARGLKGACGIVGGTIDAVQYSEQLVQAVGEYDYGKAVGRGIQLGGAVASAVGGGMVLWGAVYGGTVAGPAGAAIGAIGGVLVIGGFGVARWLSHNANETFASRCFVGKEAGKAPKPVEWSGRTIPTDDPIDEVRCLVQLLSQFQLRAAGGGGDDFLVIEPGFLEGACVFDVVVQKTSPEKGLFRLEVDVGEDVVTQREGGKLKDTHRIERDSQDNVEYISLNLENATDSPYPRPFQHYRIRVRLLGGGMVPTQLVPKNDNEGVELSVPTEKGVSSLDSQKWKRMRESPK